MSDNNNNEETPRTLGGAPASSSSWARSSDRPRVGRIGDWNNNNSTGSSRSGSGARFGTLGGLGGGSSKPAPSRNDEDEDDDSDDDGEGENWFAGGERSGISVQNPGRAGAPTAGPPGNARDIVQGLLRQAAENSGTAREQQERPRAFFGGGHTLGTEDQEGAFVPDPNAVPEDQEAVTRHITLWRNGFQIGEDGEFRSYDDPQNAALLQLIYQGRAPPPLLGVNFGQLVDLRVSKRTNEDYTPPAGVRAFVGTGQRLGAPVPSLVSGAASSSAMPGEFPATGGSSERESVSTKFEVDQTQPTTSIQIRLADGTRMVARMNLTHTVGDIRNFINASRPENLTRPYSVGTTFPNRTLENNAETIEAAKLQNSVVVQRWV